MYNDEMEEAFHKGDAKGLIEQVEHMFSIRNNSQKVFWLQKDWTPKLDIEEVKSRQLNHEDNPLIASALRNFGDRALESKKFSLASKLFLFGTYFRLDEEMLSRLCETLSYAKSDVYKNKMDVFFKKSFSERKENSIKSNPVKKYKVKAVNAATMIPRWTISNVLTEEQVERWHEGGEQRNKLINELDFEFTDEEYNYMIEDEDYKLVECE